MKNLQAQLEKMEELMNNDYLAEFEGYTFKVVNEEFEDEELGRRQVIKLKIYDDEELLYTYKTQEIYDTLEENFKSLIGSIYAEDINFRKRYITDFKGSYLTRKMKQLSKAIEKDDNKKINEINKEMTERFKTVELLKIEINDYKAFVSMLYKTKDVMLQEKEIA